MIPLRNIAGIGTSNDASYLPVPADPDETPLLSVPRPAWYRNLKGKHPPWSKSSKTRWWIWAVPLLAVLLVLIWIFRPGTDRNAAEAVEVVPPKGAPSSIPLPPPKQLTGEDTAAPDYASWPIDRRSEAIRNSFLHAWNGYEKYAMPADELRPLQNASTQNFNGWGVTMFDSLDTLWLMGLHDEFDRALVHVEKANWYMSPGSHASFFETTIRYLGGLLSAYALTNKAVLLTKADELGQRLLPVFHNSASGIPLYGVNAWTGTTSGGTNAVLAEMATCQMEYKYLAHLTGKKEYFHVVDKVMDYFEKEQRADGMWSTTWSTQTGKPVDQSLSVGGAADSAYEYLLKQYLMTGKSEKRLLEMYLKSAHGAINNLFFLSPTRDLVYATTSSYANPSRNLEHLACFYPGLLALGASALSDADFAHVQPADYPTAGVIGGDEIPLIDGLEERTLHQWAAEGMGYACWMMYADQPSGLAPDGSSFFRNDNAPAGEPGAKVGRWIDVVREWVKGAQAGGRFGGVERVEGKPPGVNMEAKPMPSSTEDKAKDYVIRDGRYLMRPETVESLYVLWRTTRDEIWRDRAWEIFLAIERNCRLGSGYASVSGVNRDGPTWMNEMPSYSLAETWKYLYLTFLPLDEDPVPMDKWVFNTEAHPLPVFEWADWEKKEYGIKG